jgi:hypothetical protein
VPSPLKILTSGIFLPTNGRHVRTPPTKSPIPIGTNVFDVENDSNDGCPLESLMGVVGHLEYHHPHPQWEEWFTLLSNHNGKVYTN